MPSPLFLHCDANAFYASCHRLFEPSLRDKPVVVLSNNDGCIVTLTREAKRLGLKRGVPYFKVKGLLQKHHVAVFSSNYELYQSISNRLMTTIETLVPSLERYSIDECFADISGLTLPAHEVGKAVRDRALQWVGIPCCIGIGPSKTLAKLCDHFAKTYPVFEGVLDWTSLSAERQKKALGQTPIQDIWGIGPQTTNALASMGVFSALDLLHLPRKTILSRFGINLLRTQEELNGHPCLTLETHPPKALQICRSRSFSKPTEHIDDLAASLSFHAQEAARVLRREKQKAKMIEIFFHTNRFRVDQTSHSAQASFIFIDPTSDASLITQKALCLLKQHFKAGACYQKAGIVLSRLMPEEGPVEQLSLFETPLEKQFQQKDGLMKTIDSIDQRFGKASLFLASQALSSDWTMKRNFLSPSYTTRWTDLLKVS